MPQPSREALALIESYANNLTARQLRVVLRQRNSFEDWALQVYEQALTAKRAARKEPHWQRNRDSMGRFHA